MTCPILLLRLLFNVKQAEQPVQRRHIPGLWHKQYKRAFIKLRLPRLFCCDAAFAPLEYFRLLQQLIFRFHLCLPRLAAIRKSDAPDDLADVFFLRFPLSIIGNTVAIVVTEGRCVLEGGSIASRGEYCDFGDGMVFAGAPVSLTEDGKGFFMTGGRISMAELEEGGMLDGDFYECA